MTFGMPIAGGTVAIIAGALCALAVVAYILKMRRRQFEVPFSALWQRVLRETETTSLWRKLKRLLSLLLQLAILGLILLAVLDPKLGAAPADARHVVVIVDASASMQALDAGDGGDRPRIEAALERAHELVSSLGSGDAAMVMRMDGQTTPLTRFESDKAVLHRALDSVDANDTPADLRRALTAAADALRGRVDRPGGARPLIVIIGDGAYSGQVLEAAVWDEIPPTADFAQKRLAAIELAGIDVRFLPVGSRSDNLGIVAFNVRRYVTNKLSYEVFVEVQNFSEQPADAELTLYNGPSAIDVRPMTLQPGERVRQLYADLGGGDGYRLRAVLRTTGADGAAARDVFSLDDEAYALLPERKRQEVLLVTRDNLFLEGAMLIYDNIRVDKLTPAEYDTAIAADDLPDYSAVVFDTHTPARVPAATNLIYFAPSGEHSPFPIAGSLSGPRITEVNDTHPVMKWVELSDVNFDQARVFRVSARDDEAWLARSIRSVIMAARTERDHKVLAFGFSLDGTDMVMRVAFPLLLVNSLDWLSGDDSDLITTYTTGQRFRVPMDVGYGVNEVEVQAPGGRKLKAPVADGQASFFGTRVGLHVLKADNARVELAANLANPAESNIAPVRELVLGGHAVEAPEAFSPTRRRSIWVYLALAALALMSLEWLTYNRRVTV